MSGANDFTNQYPQAVYQTLLHVPVSGSSGVTGTLQAVYDGVGNATALQLSTSAVQVANTTFTGSIENFTITTKPSTPSSGILSVYAKSDKHLYILDSTGTETDLITNTPTPALGDLTNVSLTSPISGDLLKYDGVNWINSPQSTLGVSYTQVSGLSTVAHTGVYTDLTSKPTLGSAAAHDTTYFVLPSNNLTDLSSRATSLNNLMPSSPTQGTITYFDGSNWVNLGPSTPGYVLKTLGAGSNPQWVAESPGGALSGLSDVTFTSLANKNLLQYDSSSSKWLNKTISGAGFATVSTTGAYSDLSGTPTLGTIASHDTSDYFSVSNNLSEGTASTIKTNLSLNNVENTAISTWTGSTNISTLGTINTGTWAGTSIGLTHGGTGQATASASFDALSPMTTLGDVIYGGTSGTNTRLAGNITATKKFFRQTGNGSVSAAPAWDTVTSTDVGLGAVENTALSTWAGTSNITTLGTISTGTWSASTIAINKGGTGQTAKTAAFDALSPLTTQGDVIYHNGTNNVRLGAGSANNVLLSGGAGANPAWSSGTFSGSSSGTNTGDQTISLTGDVTGSGTGSFATTIANAVVTYAKIQNVSATSKFLGRKTAGAGSTEELSASDAKTILAIANTDVSGLGTMSTQNASAVAITGGSATFDQTGLKILDAGTHTLQIKDNETLTVNRTLSILTGDASRSLTFTADTTIGGTHSGTSSGTNTGDQTITLSTDATGSGTGTVAVTLAQPLHSLVAYNTNGLLTQTAQNTFTGRTLTGTASQITVTNGSGVSGNPTLSLPSQLILPTNASACSIGLLEASANGTNVGTITVPASLTADRTYTLPNATGTVALTSDITGTNSNTNTGDQNLFSTISVSGQSDVVADSTADTLTIVAGTGMTITTNASTDTITFAASGGTTASVVAPVAGFWYPMIPTCLSPAATASDTQAVSFVGSFGLASKFWLYPFEIVSTTTFTKLAVNVQALELLSSINLAVYAHNASTNKPTGSALVSANLSGAATGAVSATGLSFSATPGIYWMGIQISSELTLSLYCYQGSGVMLRNIIGLGSVGATIGGNQNMAYRMSNTFSAGVYPTPASLTESTASGNWPIAYLGL